MAEICSVPFRCGGVSLGGDVFVLLCDGIAYSCVFVGVGQEIPVFPHMSLQPQTLSTCTFIVTMMRSRFKSCPHPSSWSPRRTLVVGAAPPRSRLSGRTL